MAESRETRCRRIRMRAWHRGTQEMDLILGGFCDRHLDGLDEAQLDALEQLMAEPDPDIYAWLSGRREAPPRHHRILELIAADIEEIAPRRFT